MSRKTTHKIPNCPLILKSIMANSKAMMLLTTNLLHKRHIRLMPIKYLKFNRLYIVKPFVFTKGSPCNYIPVT